ncbi:hypothetical protein Tco_0483511 [Tanacetum coccineum]
MLQLRRGLHDFGGYRVHYRRFSHRNDEVVFIMPQRTQELQLISPLEKDKFEAFFVESLRVRNWDLNTFLRKERVTIKLA